MPTIPIEPIKLTNIANILQNKKTVLYLLVLLCHICEQTNYIKAVPSLLKAGIGSIYCTRLLSTVLTTKAKNWISRTLLMLLIHRLHLAIGKQYNIFEINKLNILILQEIDHLNVSVNCGTWLLKSRD